MQQEETGRLAGQTAVITGGASGIGRGIAEAFVSEGADTIIADINKTQAEDIVSELGPENADAIQVDVSESESVQAMADTVSERYDSVDILVNNAGINRVEGSVVDASEEDWDEVIDINLKGVFLTSKYVIPLMPEGSAVVNMGSISSKRALEGNVAYVASKGGVKQLTKAMALDHVGDDIRVNCVCPGFIETPLSAERLDEGADEDLQYPMARELDRIGQPEDVAHAVVYFASDESSYVTGATLSVDGGWAME